MVKLSVDQNICIGCGSCTSIAQNLFEMDKEFKAKVKKEEDLTEEEEKQAKEAIEICPVKCIKIIS